MTHLSYPFGVVFSRGRSLFPNIRVFKLLASFVSKRKDVENERIEGGGYTAAMREKPSA
jgi:hypothetical protein